MIHEAEKGKGVKKKRKPLCYYPSLCTGHFSHVLLSCFLFPVYAVYFVSLYSPKRENEDEEKLFALLLQITCQVCETISDCFDIIILIIIIIIKRILYLIYCSRYISFLC